MMQTRHLHNLFKSEKLIFKDNMLGNFAECVVVAADSTALWGSLIGHMILKTDAVTPLIPFSECLPLVHLRKKPGA